MSAPTVTRRRHLTAVPTPTEPAAPAEPTPARAGGRLLAIDGNSLGHRAWHAYKTSGMTDPAGQPNHAVYGFLALLAGIMDRTDPHALLIGFDDPDRCARRETFPGYKAGRGERDPDLHAQMTTIIGTLRALGVQVVVPDGLEADDVIGSAAAAAEAAGWQCTIATSDKDAYALISDTTTLMRLVSGVANAPMMTPAALHTEHGVTPAQWLDHKILTGDKSDALPGVDGIGPKTATRLLAAVGSLEVALGDPAAVVAAVGKAAAAKLTAPGVTEVVARNRQVMAIRRDLPVDVEACRLVSTPGEVAAVLRARGLPRLVERLTTALCPAVPAPAPAPTAAPVVPAQRAPLTAAPAPAGPAKPADPFPPVGCQSCGRSVRWVPSYAGKPIPLDAARRPDGPVVLDRIGADRWAARAITARDIAARPRYGVHWTTCTTPSLYANTKTAADPRGEFPAIHRSGSQAGPCSKCRGYNPRLYGPNASPLCPPCGREAAAKWSPEFRRLHQVND